MKKIALLLSFVAGATDTIGFSLLYQIFTAHVTGNFVLIGSSVIQAEEELVWARLAVLPLFFGTIVIASLFVPKTPPTARTARGFLAVQALFLVLFLLAGEYLHENVDNITSIIISAPAVIAMAMQNMYSKFLFKGLPFTTVMTGNVTQIAMNLGNGLKKNSSTGDNHLLSVHIYAVIGFIVGAIIIAYAAKFMGFSSMLIPVSIMVYLAFSVHSEHR